MKTNTKMNVTMQSIGPALARQMLENNTGNRPINPSHVDILAKEMLRGQWKVNGDTICLNDYRIIDGQHRLLAIVKSGVTIQTLLVAGLDSDVFDTKDVGRRRSAADTLSVRGEVETKKLASALVVVDRYMTSRMVNCVRYTNTEIEGLLESYPEVRRSIGACRETKKLVAQSVLVACHYLFSRLDIEQADVFIRQLISGLGLEEGEAVYVLRERLMKNSLAKAKLSQHYIMALIIKAWNSRRAGKAIRNLRYRETGDAAETFPVVA